MSENLLRLVYISCATSTVDKILLHSILERSRANNLRSGVTGVLCGGPRHFLQVLEGPELEVLGLYGRVSTDSRHHGCTLLNIELIATRMFSEWSMAYIEGQLETADVKAPLLALRRLEGGSEAVALLLKAFMRRLSEQPETPTTSCAPPANAETSVKADKLSAT